VNGEMNQREIDDYLLGEQIEEFNDEDRLLKTSSFR